MGTRSASRAEIRRCHETLWRVLVFLAAGCVITCKVIPSRDELLSMSSLQEVLVRQVSRTPEGPSAAAPSVVAVPLDAPETKPVQSTRTLSSVALPRDQFLTAGTPPQEAVLADQDESEQVPTPAQEAATTLPTASIRSVSPSTTQGPSSSIAASGAVHKCKLPLCMFHNAGALRLYVNEHSDGAGHRLKNIIEGIAISLRFGLNLGGALPVGTLVTEHGHNFRDILNAFFGVGAGDELVAASREVPVEKTINTVEALDSWLQSRGDNAAPVSSVYLPSVGDWQVWAGKNYIPAETIFPDDLRAALGQELAKLPLPHFDPARPSVAIHVRRGDLRRDDKRVIPDQYYLDMIQQIKKHIPEADVHIWSSLENAEAYKRLKHWNVSDFDVFRREGITLHLDDPGLVEPWAHLARADVLIMSQSAFSAVPAYLNLNCVIFYGHNLAPLGNWLDGTHQDRRTYKRELRSCLARAKKKKQRG